MVLHHCNASETVKQGCQSVHPRGERASCRREGLLRIEKYSVQCSASCWCPDAHGCTVLQKILQQPSGDLDLCWQLKLGRAAAAAVVGACTVALEPRPTCQVRTFTAACLAAACTHQPVRSPWLLPANIDPSGLHNVNARRWVWHLTCWMMKKPG